MLHQIDSKKVFTVPLPGIPALLCACGTVTC